MRSNHRTLNLEYPFFIILLPLFFVLHGVLENFGLVPAKDALLLTFFYIAVGLLLTLLFKWLFGSLQKGALFTFILSSFHFFFGAMHDGLKNLLGDVWLTKYSFLIPVCAILLFAAFIFFKKTTLSFNRFTRFLNVLFFVLILLDAVQLVVKKPHNLTVSSLLSTEFKQCDTCARPDVYLIIADEYSGAQALQDLFGFDNGGFETALASRGFHTVKASKSNYNFTPFSVAATLNFSYLPVTDTTNINGDVFMAMDKIKNNRLTTFLKSHGYTFYNHSYFDIGNEPTKTTSTFLPTKTKYITAQTFFSRFRADVYFNLATRFKLKWAVADYFYHHKKSNAQLFQSTIETAANNQSPKFTYTHLMLPHYPYYFDEEGRESSFEEVVDNYKADRYIGYLKFANKQYLKLIDHILNNSKIPPIIVLVSDHGFRELSKVNNRQYNFVNICSIYTPDKNYKPFYDGMSNVNLFRVLLNTSFGQQLPLLPDSTIYLD